MADKFGAQLEAKEAAWIFTSATLEVGGTFNHFCQRLGIENATQKKFYIVPLIILSSLCFVCLDICRILIK